MSKKVLVIFCFIFLIHFALSLCGTGQININSATIEELDLLIGIGPAYAQDIIDARPYSSVDDLDRAKNIGPSRLAKIKMQGLACIDSNNVEIAMEQEIKESDVEPTSQPEPESKLEPRNIIPETLSPINANVVVKPETESIINLNPESENTSEKVIYESRNEKIRKYSIYAFAFFLLIVISFLLLDKNGRTENYSDNDC